MKKQVRLKIVLEIRFSELPTKLEVATKDIINHITGGDSVPRLMIGNIKDAGSKGLWVALEEIFIRCMMLSHAL